MVQLSYWAARIRKTKNEGEAEDEARGRARLQFLEGDACPFVGEIMRGSAAAAARCMAATAWPELKPGAAAPLISAEP